MKKMLSLLLVAVMSTMASASVITLSTYDVGGSGGRLGTAPGPDALLPGDTVGLEMVLQHNPYAGSPSYDGNFTSQFALKLAASGHGTLSVPEVVVGKNTEFDVKMHTGFALGVKKISAVAGDNPVTNGGLNIDFLEAALLSGGVSANQGATALVWNIMFTATGGDNTTMDLLAGTGGLYAPYQNFTGDNYYPESSPITNGELTGTTIYQYEVPEPMTLSLFGLGGIAALRRRRA